MEIEPLLGTAQMRANQQGKAVKLVERLYDATPFWRQRLDAAGAQPGKIRTLEDFSARVPIFDKAQRRQLAEDHDMDMMKAVEASIGVPLDRVVLMAATSGTTGEPTFYPFTEHDINWVSQAFGRMFWRMGLRPGQRVVHAFGLSMTLAGVPYVHFIRNYGACVFPVGAEGGAERLLTMAKHVRPDMLCATPSLVEHLIERAPGILNDTVGSLGIKRIMAAGEPGAGIPELRAKIEGAYGAELFDHGAGFGISSNHPEYLGMHWVADDLALYELVDPDTHEPIPLEDGARGLAVFTTLDGEGFLWLRETFGDIHEVTVSPSPDGQTGLRYKVVGRTDDMLKVKGVIVYPAAIDGVITGFGPQLTGEFRIVLDEPPPRVVPPLTLKVEHAEHVSADELPVLAKEIEDSMSQQLKFRPRIEWLGPGVLERSNLKTNFFERTYLTSASTR